MRIEYFQLIDRIVDLNLADQTAFLDRLLMYKLDSEIAAMRRAAKLADDGYAVFRQAARVGRADYELIAEIGRASCRERVYGLV